MVAPVLMNVSFLGIHLWSSPLWLLSIPLSDSCGLDFLELWKHTFTFDEVASMWLVLQGINDAAQMSWFSKKIYSMSK